MTTPLTSLPPRPTLFVGREAELDRLTEAFERLAVALICGVAGVGKTALASAFAARWPALVIRTDLAGDSLAELVDDASRLLGPGATAMGSVEARLRELAERLDRAAGLWLIDDLHRLPASDRRLCFRALGQTLRRGRVIATSRERVGVDAGGSDHVELRLGGLDEPEARQLWLELDGLYGPAGGFDAAMNRSAGNPFLLRRRHAGDISDEDPLGDSVAALAPAERRVAGALAVAELSLPVPLLEELLPPGTGREVLRRLADKMIIEVRADGGASMHDLVRDAVLRSLAAGERSDLHADLARLLSGADLDPARRARAVCRHLRALDRHEEAARYLIERGSELDKYGAAGELLRGLAAIPQERRTREASAALAMVSTRVFDLERAFAEHERLLGAGVGPPELVLIHALLALLTGRPDVAESSLDRVEPSTLPPGLRMRALTIRSVVRAFAGEPGEAPRLLAAAADEASDPATAAPLWLYAAFILWCVEERDHEAHDAIVRALVLRGDGALSYRSNVLASMVRGGIAACLGRFPEAEEALGEADRLMAGDEDALLTSYVHYARAWFLCERGDWEAARAELRRFIDVLEHGGHMLGSITYRALEARILLLMGRRVEALNLMARCRELARERNLPGIVRVVDRALALDPARLLEPVGDAGRAAGGRPSERVWNRLGEAIRCAAAGEAGRMSALLAGEEPELARPGHELGRVLGAIARAVLAEVRGDAGAARDELAAAAAQAAAAEIDDDLVPALFGAVGTLRVVCAAGVRVSHEPPPSRPDQIVLDARTHDLALGEQTVSLLKRPVLRRLLYCLARVNGAVVSKDDLARALWSRPHNPLSDDGPLKSNIANLRKLIEQAGMSIDFDEVGYRLVGVERLLFVEPVTWRVDPV